jgi:hypothetical protein
MRFWEAERTESLQWTMAMPHFVLIPFPAAAKAYEVDAPGLLEAAAAADEHRGIRNREHEIKAADYHPGAGDQGYRVSQSEDIAADASPDAMRVTARHLAVVLSSPKSVPT